MMVYVRWSCAGTVGSLGPGRSGQIWSMYIVLTRGKLLAKKSERDGFFGVQLQSRVMI